MSHDPWANRLSPNDWRSVCQVNCGRTTTKCPVCDHKCHRAVWVDLNTDDQIIIVGQHAHFVRPNLRDAARNWNHKIQTRKVDPRVFELVRKIHHTQYLPNDIRRIFDEQ